MITEGGRGRWLAFLDRWWNPGAAAAWGIALLALIGRTLLSPDRATNYDRYARAGRAWFDGLPLYVYTPNKGFVYAPFSAICHAIGSLLPDPLGRSVWHLISAGLILAGLVAMMRVGPFRRIPTNRQGLVCLLVFPLALGNIDSAQANPLVIGLIMLGVAAACADRWTLAALALAVAVWWKVYPIVVGALLILLAPRKFTWRFVLALILLGLLPFLFQKPSYVIDQYQLWYATRTADNRLAYALHIAPLDLWFLLVRAGGLPMSNLVYRGIQMTAGAGIAFFCLYGYFRQWPKERLYGGMFSLVCAWMVLLGPASEIHTYLVIAPAAALAVVESLSGRMKPAARILAWAAYACFLFAILRVGFVPKVRLPWLLALQPIGAIIFSAYAIRHYLDEETWQAQTPPPASG